MADLLRWAAGMVAAYGAVTFAWIAVRAAYEGERKDG